MQVIFRKIIILGLLLGCVWVFGVSEGNVVVRSSAAGCIQDCEASEAMCRDDCATACSTSDTDCNACWSTCNSEFRSCMRTAEWCDGGGGYYSSACQWQYAAHCPVINGVPDYNNCHNGWYQYCTYTNSQCIICPTGEWCYGANGTPACW